MELEPGLPQDLVNEILPYLPVKSLARFKCVSRHWRTLISSRSFVKSVLERYPEPNSTLLHLCGKINRGMIFPRHNGDASFTGSFKLEHPLLGLRLKGTFHGLVCFSNYTTGDACVLNPLTNQSRTFGFQHQRYGTGFGCEFCFFGFGFDSINDDYKVVKISTTDHESQASSFMIEIRQLRNTTPREIVLHEVPFKLFDCVTPVTVDGSSHWIAFHKRNWSLQIVRFDMDHEKFLEIPFSADVPNVDYENYIETLNLDGWSINGKRFSLGIFKGSLCLFVNHLSGSKLEAWSMNCKNHDRSDLAWTRIFEVQPSRYIIKAMYGFTPNDEVVVDIKDIGYGCYDPWKDKCILPSRKCRSQLRDAVAYVESLVPVWPQ